MVTQEEHVQVEYESASIAGESVEKSSSVTQGISLSHAFLIIFLHLTIFIIQMIWYLNNISQSFRETAICSSLIFLFFFYWLDYNQ